MIVDCEVYYHGPTGSPGGEVLGIEALDALCREAGVDKAVLMPAPTFYPRNQALADALGTSAGARGRFVGCALVNPHLGDDAIDELERAVREWEFRAAKLMPTLHAINLVGRIAHPLMRKAQELGIPVTIHSAGSPAHPLEIGVLAEAFPRVPVIMDHNSSAASAGSSAPSEVSVSLEGMRGHSTAAGSCPPDRRSRMRIVRVEPQQARAPQNPEYFSGNVRQQRLHQTTEPGGIDLVAVFFEPGARTRPHVHGADQALHVVEGEGIVATEDERRLIRPGDIVIIPAGRWHWHGATPTSAMCHISARPVSSTDWAVPVRDWEAYMRGARG